jgi:hypothetical protein
VTMSILALQQSMQSKKLKAGFSFAKTEVYK